MINRVIIINLISRSTTIIIIIMTTTVIMAKSTVVVLPRLLRCLSFHLLSLHSLTLYEAENGHHHQHLRQQPQLRRMLLP
jgi:hypothetical protein